MTDAGASSKVVGTIVAVATVIGATVAMITIVATTTTATTAGNGIAERGFQDPGSMPGFLRQRRGDHHVPALTPNANIYGSTIASSFSNAVGTQFTQIGSGTGGTNHNVLRTTVVSPWTLATTTGYAYTPGDSVTASTDTSLNGMISYYQSANQLQVYTKLSDFITWINAN